MNSSAFNEENTGRYVTNVIIFRQPIFTFDWACEILLENLRFYKEKYGFALIGYVIMPDHFHNIILPKQGTSLSAIMRDFKKYTAVEIIRHVNRILTEQNLSQIPSLKKPPKFWDRSAPIPELYQMMAAFKLAGRLYRNTKHKIWQDDFYSTLIWTPRVIKKKLDYMHANPLRWELVEDPADWRHSSYRCYYLGEESPVKLDISWAILEEGI